MTEPTVAGPRRPISTEPYTGTELQTRSARPGAYDALALPSRMGDRQVLPGGARVSLPSAKKPQPVPLLHRAAPAAPPTPPPALSQARAVGPDYAFTTGSIDAINPDLKDRRFWPIEQPDERPPTPRTDAAADLQRAIDSAQALAATFAQLEQQTLIVAALIGDALARLTPPPSPFPTAA